MRFFMPMIPPTTTAQMRRVTTAGGKPVFYEGDRLKDARAKLTAHLGGHAPKTPFDRGLGLRVKWCFPAMNKHRDGDYRTNRPDLDNLQKLLKDCMTACGFWQDDALVACEVVEKFWARDPGIFVEVWEL